MTKIVVDQKSRSGPCRLTILEGDQVIFTDRDGENRELFQTGVIAHGKVDAATLRFGLAADFAPIYHDALLNNFDEFDF